MDSGGGSNKMPVRSQVRRMESFGER